MSHTQNVSRTDYSRNMKGWQNTSVLPATIYNGSVFVYWAGKWTNLVPLHGTATDTSHCIVNTFTLLQFEGKVFSLLHVIKPFYFVCFFVFFFFHNAGHVHSHVIALSGIWSLVLRLVLGLV